VQLGEAVDGEKPKRAGLPKSMAPEEVDLQRALALLSLPREVGRHPEDDEPIRAGIGRFGPYVQHGKTYANLESGDDVFTIGLNRAVTLIAEKLAKGPRFRRFGADPGRALGDHPTKGGAIVAKNGRYGPYVSHAGVNATLPRDKTPETITLDEAAALLDARAERSAPAPHARPRKRARAAAAARSAKRPETSGADRVAADRPGTKRTGKRSAGAGKRAAAPSKKRTRKAPQAAE
jgi:DNA topoisomerase-1